MIIRITPANLAGINNIGHQLIAYIGGATRETATLFKSEKPMLKNDKNEPIAGTNFYMFDGKAWFAGHEADLKKKFEGGGSGK